MVVVWVVVRTQSREDREIRAVSGEDIPLVVSLPFPLIILRRKESPINSTFGHYTVSSIIPL